MSKTRSYAIVGIFVAAAILTPTPDIFTLMLMAAPMIVLYEICIWLAYFDRKKSRILEEQEARERMERQLAREEQIRAEEQIAQYQPEDYDWHQQHPENEENTHESGDDGWQEEKPEAHLPTSDKIPELDEAPPEKKPDSDDETGKNA